MNEETNKEEIKKKLSGKYEKYYPIYEKLRDRIFKFGKNIKFILKTIYIRISFDNEAFAVIYWKNDGLYLGLPINIKSERFKDAAILKYKGINSMVKLSNLSDVDNYIIDILKKINKA